MLLNSELKAWIFISLEIIVLLQVRMAENNLVIENSALHCFEADYIAGKAIKMTFHCAQCWKHFIFEKVALKMSLIKINKIKFYGHEHFLFIVTRKNRIYYFITINMTFQAGWRHFISFFFSFHTWVSQVFGRQLEKRVCLHKRLRRRIQLQQKQNIWK